jgi:hypothetical protein
MAKAKTLTFKQATAWLIEEINKAHAGMKRGKVSGYEELIWNLAAPLNGLFDAHLNGEKAIVKTVLKHVTDMKAEWLED